MEPGNVCDTGEGGHGPVDTSCRYHCDGQPEGLPDASPGDHGHRQQEGPPNPSTGDHGGPHGPSTADHGNRQQEGPPNPSTGDHGGLHGPSTADHGNRQQEGPPNPSTGDHGGLHGPSTGDHGNEQQDELPDPEPTYQDQGKRAGAPDLSYGCPGVTDDAPPSPEELSPAAAICHQQGEGEAFCMSPQANSAMATCTTEPGSATAGLSVSTTGGAGRDNSEQGVAVQPACPQHSQQVGRALPAEPVNQSQQAEKAPEPLCEVPARSQESGALSTRQDTGDPARIQESGHLTTSQDTGGPATSQESGAPASSQESGDLTTRQDTGEPATSQESGAPASSQESGHLTTSQESGEPATNQESGDQTTRQEIRPPTTSQEIDAASRSQEAVATATSTGSASTPQRVLPQTVSQEVTRPSTVQDISLLPRAVDTPASPTEAALSGTSSSLGISSLPSHPPPPATDIPCSSTATPQELSSPPIAPGRDSLRTKAPMEVEQEDNLSDSGVSADFSPGSTLEMDGEVANETPIEREIRRHAEREETLRKERGMAPTADHQQFVEVKMRPILNRGLADTFPPKEKDRQRAGAQMQRDIRMESQREEDLVQLGKVMGAYDRGLPQELRQKKMVFEQKAELSNGELASLRKITRSPYGEVQPANNSSYRDVETMRQQSSGSPAMVQQRSTGEKKGPSYAEANGSNVIILDYNSLLHRTPTGREPPTQAQGTGLGSELSNVSQSASNGLQPRTSNVTTNSLQSGTPNISQSPANDLLLSSGGQQPPASPTEDEVVQENPFFRLKTKSPQSLLELEIREVRERESELRRLRRSLYGGQHAQGTVGDNGSDPAKEHSDEPEAAPGQPERPYSGKLEVTWPPRGWGQADRKESEQEDRSASMARQKNSLLQRWETGMVSSQQSMEDE